MSKEANAAAAPMMVEDGGYGAPPMNRHALCCRDVGLNHRIIYCSDFLIKTK